MSCRRRGVISHICTTIEKQMIGISTSGTDQRRCICRSWFLLYLSWANFSVSRNFCNRSRWIGSWFLVYFSWADFSVPRNFPDRSRLIGSWFLVYCSWADFSVSRNLCTRSRWGVEVAIQVKNIEGKKAHLYFDIAQHNPFPTSCTQNLQ